MLSSGGSVAIIATGLLVPLLIDQNPAQGWRNTWFIFGGLVVIIGIASQVFLRDRPEERSGSLVRSVSLDEPRPSLPLTVFKNPWVWLMTYLALCSGFVSGIFSTFFGAYLTDANTVSFSAAGQLFLMIGVLSVLSGILWGRVSDRLGRGPGFALAYLVQGMGYALFWLIPIMGVFYFRLDINRRDHPGRVHFMRGRLRRPRTGPPGHHRICYDGLRGQPGSDYLANNSWGRRRQYRDKLGICSGSRWLVDGGNRCLGVVHL